MYTVGFDPGNSEATLTNAAPGQKRGDSLTLPSFIGSGSMDALLRIRGGSSEAVQQLGKTEHVIEYGGRSYFVGDLALSQAPDPTSARGDVTRYWTGHTLRLLLTLAAKLFSHRSTIPLRVVTGLPVSVWSKETAAQVRKHLTGTHTFTWNGQPRTVVVEGVMVVMEGAGALVAHGLTDDVPQGVIDVGGRTTDLFWAQGMKPELRRCDGAPLGVEKAGDLLCDYFQRQYGRELERHELREVFRAVVEGREHRPLFADGAPVRINGLAEQMIASVGDEIASLVARKWRESEQGKVASSAAKVLLIGGGAHYFAPQLKQLIPHLETPRHPELANAQGYLSLGLQISDERWIALGGR